MPHSKPGRVRLTASYGYEEIAEIAEMSLNAVHQHAARGNLKLESFEGVMLFIAEHSPTFQRKLLDAMIGKRKAPARSPGPEKKQGRRLSRKVG